MHCITKRCAPGKRCRDYSNCYACKQIRQKKIADAAEHAFLASKQLTFTVITPIERGHEALKAIKRSYLKRCALHAGLYTIEKGAIAERLHINLISDGYAPTEHERCNVWQEKAIAKVRDLAHYISKPESQPSSDDYPGKTWGTVGQITRLLSDASQPLHLQMAAAEKMLDLTTDMEQEPQPPVFSYTKETYTREQYREIAARHLPKLHAILALRRNI